MAETYRVRTDGAIIALYAGALLIQSVAAVPGAVRLVYDGVQVKVLNDGVQLIATPAAAGQLLFPKVVPFNTGVSTYDIAIGPAGLQPDVNANIVDSGGPNLNPLSRTDLVTPIGVAAGFVGQGALSTENAVDLATSQVVGKSLANLDGPAWGKLSAIESLADVTFTVTGTPADSVTAKSDGTFETGILPKYLYFDLTAKAGNFTADSGVTWDFSIVSGTAGTTGGVNAGRYRIAISSLDTTTVFEATATIAGVVRGRFKTTLTKIVAAAATGSSGSGGGTTATTPASGYTNSATFADMTGTMTCQAGATGQVALSAPMEYLLTGGALSGTGGGKWQWRVVGGTFADVAAASNGAAAVNDAEGSQTPGGKTWTATKTGLTNGVAYEFRFMGASNSARQLTWYSVSNCTANGS